MPSREDIDKFLKVLETVGAPSGVRSTGEISRPEGPAVETMLPEEGPPPDIGELLGSLGDLAPSDESPRAEATPKEGADEFAGLDFDSLFGEEAETGPLEVIGEPGEPGTESVQPPVPLEEAGPEQPTVESFETLEAPLPPDIGEPFSSGQIPEQPEENVMESGAGPSGAAGPEEPEGLDMLTRDLGPLDELLPPPVETGPDETAPEMEAPILPEESEFEIPSLEPPPAPMPQEEPSIGTEPLSGEGLQETAPEAFAPESIELPSFEEMSLPGEEPPAMTAPEEPLIVPPEPLQPPAEFDTTEQPPAAGAAEPQMESLPEEGVDELGLDEFTLPESVEEFGISRKSSEAPQERKPEGGRGRLGQRQEALEELAEAEAEIALTEEQFSRFKKCLDSLPRNLRMSVQDVVIGELGSGPDLKKLIDLLAAGASPREIAALAGKMSGKRIRLPAEFEKRTGIAFEAERRTFGYAFRENIFPVVRVFTLTAVALGLVIFLGYRFVYRPMYAYTNYRAGYDHLLGDRYQLANQRFAGATLMWPMKGWFYRYAEGFTAKGRYMLAADKYEELLRRWPRDKKGIIDYARMTSTKLLDYKKADELLKRILDVRLYDYDALLASGDNNMEWGEEDPSRYEEARVEYASAIEKYGQRDEILFRMLRYFIRTNNYKEAERLRQYFAGRENVKVDAAAYAELGGYLIDVNELSYVQEVLFKALEAKPDLPEIHYNLARYYRAVNDPGEEMKALQGAIMYLKRVPALSRSRIVMDVDSHTRLGELYDKNREYLNAEREYREAIRIVEDAQKRKMVGAERILGLPYYDLGDLAYYVQGDLKEAFLQYQKAMENGYKTPEMDYKIGYIRYAQEDYKAALDSFLNAAEAMNPDRVPLNLLYAAGNAFYQRADYFAAQGYYLRLSDILNDRRAGISNFQPTEQEDHRSLVEYMLKTDNNLGVALYRLSVRMGDVRKRSQALAYLAAAAEQYDVLSRDPETLKKPETQNLASLNMRGILYPPSKFDPQIYRLIPKDLESPLF